MHIHMVTLKSHWVEKGKKKRQARHPSGSVPRVERVATERQAVGGVETSWMVVRCTSMSSCSQWQSSLAVSPVWCRSLGRSLLSNIDNECANSNFSISGTFLFLPSYHYTFHQPGQLRISCYDTFSLEVMNEKNRTIMRGNISVEKYKKDTVLFAFLWCAIHSRQCSSDTTEQLQNKVRRMKRSSLLESKKHKMLMNRSVWFGWNISQYKAVHIEADVPALVDYSVWKTEVHYVIGLNGKGILDSRKRLCIIISPTPTVEHTLNKNIRATLTFCVCFVFE